jgi:hypothetical protein
VFTSPLHRNGNSSVVACVYISAGTCLSPLPSNELFRLSCVMSHICFGEMCNSESVYFHVHVLCYMNESSSACKSFHTRILSAWLVGWLVGLFLFLPLGT